MPLFKKKGKGKFGEPVTVAVTTHDGYLLSVDMGSKQKISDLRQITADKVNVRPAENLVLFLHGVPLEDSLVLEDTDAVQKGEVILMKLKAPASPMPVGGGGGAPVALPDPLAQLAAMNPVLFRQLMQMHPGLGGRPVTAPMGRGALGGGMVGPGDLSNPSPNVVAQQRAIENAIQHQSRNAALDRALNEIPESFTDIEMLYVVIDIEGTEVKALVDTGASATTMTFACAQKCGLVDQGKINDRFVGVVHGVTGTTEIVGKIPIQDVRIGKGKTPLTCSFTVIAGDMGGTEVLLGLDTLVRNDAVVDLRPGKRSLTMGKDKISFVGAS